MTNNDIIYIQKRIGTKPDGFWGPKSAAACRKHLTSLMPKPNPWPSPDLASMVKFYGEAGESHLVSMPIPISFGVRFGCSPVKSIRCHHMVADSLYDILLDLAGGPAAWILKEYAGCYDNRPMRTSKSLSKHAWGVAIDLAPGSNGLWTVWPNKSSMPIEAMEAFAKRGWKNLGWLIGRDAMHFEATK